MKTGLLLAPLLLLATAALPDDFVIAKGRLSDADFYRLVACGRPPGGICRMPLRRWPADLARDLTVTKLSDIEPVWPTTAAQIDLALDLAIDQINNAGAGIRLRRVDDNAPALIRLQVRSPRTMALISGETTQARIPAGMVMPGGASPDRITAASIVISSAIALTETNSVVLEELTQSLGLPFDISGKYYRRRSIFSQESNGVTRLTGQDITALRLHYPPTP